MDAMLQRHCARYIYVVPSGLRELMSDISREVLRSQPEDIYTFIADYLDALMITRENARVSAKFVQYMTDAAETLIDLLSSSGMSKAEANHAAEVIQEAFRTWSSRKGILKEDEETIVARIIEDTGISELQAQEAAICIQNAFRAFKMRQEREQEFLTGVVDWRVAARSAIKLYRKTGVSPEEAKRAANLIKAAYKGYYTRRTLQQLNEVNAAIEEEEPAMMGDDMSMASGFSDRKKEVRIDYQTVVPHVDFGDEELISRELTTIMDDELGGMDDDQDVMDKIFGSGRKKESTTEDFVKELLEEYVLKPITKKKSYEFSRRMAQEAEKSKQRKQKMDKLQKESLDAKHEMEKPQGIKPTVEATEAETTEDVQQKTPSVTQSEVVSHPEAPSEVVTELPSEAPSEVVPEDEVATEVQVTEPVEAAAEAPTEAEVPTEVSAEAPTEEPPEVPTEEPTEAPTEEPTEALTEVSEAAAEVPIEAPEKVPTETPEEVPTEAPEEVPTEALEEVPTEAPEEIPTETPEEVLTEAPEDVPTEASEKVPAETPQEVPSEAPEEVPTETTD